MYNHATLGMGLCPSRSGTDIDGILISLANELNASAVASTCNFLNVVR